MAGRTVRSLGRLRALLDSSTTQGKALRSGAQQLRGLATATQSTAEPLGLSYPVRAVLGLSFAAAAGYTGYHYAYPLPSTDHLTSLQADEHPHDIGTFTLTEASGKTFTEKNVKKEFNVLLFQALDHPQFKEHMDRFAHALYESDEKCNQEHLKPVLLCLDHMKDTPERCKEAKDSLRSHKLYKETLHRRVAIATGEDVSKIHEAAHSFTTVFYGKHPKNTGTPCSTDLGILYLVSPEGKFLEAYDLVQDTPEDISTDWATIQQKWNIHHPTWHGCRNVARRYA